MACPSETLLQAFCDGALSEDEIRELSSHLDACDDCRALVGAVQPVPWGDTDDGPGEDRERVGRYVLRRILGKGGMGIVYEAVDPELQRVVALKILRADLGEAEERLLREAKALALLSHPNVVTIHDVGRAGERIFLVMELVKGATLRHWLAREERSLAEVLDAFEQAGAGLCAAHDAGLVHRDFKPDNVFVAEGGRVVVGDFGLALTRGEAAREAAGSRAYMAPEQARATAGAHDAIDARADQYAFCVSLEEALGDARTAPAWLSRLVARGRAAQPDDRFPSMAALLAALREGRRPKRRRAIAIGLGVLGAAALTFTVVASLRAREERREQGARVAACVAEGATMTTLWNADVAAETERAFRAAKSPLAPSAWAKTSATLGSYADAWQDAHRRTCEATRDPTPEARAAFERKKSCLDERAAMVRALASSLRRVDAPMLEQIPSMLQLLPRVEACEDVREIARRPEPPSPSIREATSEARAKIASAAVTVAAGRYQEAITLAEGAWTAANALGYLPVLAEAYLVVGSAHGRLGHTREAEQALEQAASSASAGQEIALAIRAWIALMHFVGYEGKRYEDGFRYGKYAEAALRSMPDAFELEAERLLWTRAMLVDQRREGEALAVARELSALVELRLGPSHRLAAAALDGLAGVLAGTCRARAALEPQARACKILEDEHGAPHPQLALCLGNLASLHANLGEHRAALPLKERALAMFEELPGHPNHVAMARRNMVRTLLEVGELQRARATLEAASASAQHVADETSVLVLRGELARREGDAARAVADHGRAVTRSEGLTPARRIEPLVALAESEIAAGRFVDAGATAARASSLAREVYGERSCRVALPLRVEADSLLRQGRAASALPLAERALSLTESAEVDPLALARAELSVARALPVGARPRARELATSARARLPSDPRSEELAAQIDTWLAAAP